MKMLPSIGMKILKIINHYSFILVATLLVSFELVYILKGYWSGDFWEHSAVVNELSRNLLHPNNPIIQGNIPHPLISPYSVLVAIFSKITNLNPILALTYFAFFNLIFFLFSFHKFCVSVFRGKSGLVSTISLLLILFFFGKNPLLWSGFYHILTLNYVLPYPSTFAMSLTFLILSLIWRGLCRYYLE